MYINNIKLNKIRFLTKKLSPQMASLRHLQVVNFCKNAFGGDFMATLRYKNPTTQKWELVGVGGSTGGDQIVFSKLADFPSVATALTDKVYIDVDTSKSYIIAPDRSAYVLVGDGVGTGTADWQHLT